MKKTYFFTALCALVIFCGNLFPQVKPDSKYSDTLRVSGSFKIEGSFQKGNTDKASVLSGEDIKLTYKKLESILSTYFDYGESDGIKDQNNIFSSFTVDLWYESSVSPFFLQLTEHSFEKELDLRSQTGAGVKYTFIEIPEFKASISAAGIYDYTDLKDKPGNVDSKTPRLSMRLKFSSFLFDSLIGISHFTFYQPSTERFKNVIWRSETELAFKITQVLALSSTFRYTHQDVVPAGVKKDDYKLTFGLKISF